jgi:RNA polymerase-binding transcription factor DksA
MNEEDKKKLQTKLEEELKLLESELKSIGRRNPSNPDDWEATQGDAITGGADRNESADGIEQYEEHSAILKELETRYNNVKLALEKISNGNYGICEIVKRTLKKLQENSLGFLIYKFVKSQMYNL